MMYPQNQAVGILDKKVKRNEQNELYHVRITEEMQSEEGERRKKGAS